MCKDKIIIKCTTLKCIYRFKDAASETTSIIATFKGARDDITRGYPFIKGFGEIFTIAFKSIR